MISATSCGPLDIRLQPIGEAKGKSPLETSPATWTSTTLVFRMATLANESNPRKNRPAKPIPRLPLSAFSPPNSGTGEKFPLPPSPATVHPQVVYDAGFAVSSIDGLKSYASALGSSPDPRLAGVVVSLPDANLDSIEQITASSTVPVLAVSVPISKSSTPSSSSSHKLVYSTAFVQPAPSEAEAIKSALQSGVVTIDVQTDLSTEAGWESLEEFLTSVLGAKETEEPRPAIVLSNILPPPKALEMPTVTLLSHPSYIAYQGHSATVSFFESVYVSLSPPDWGAVPSPVDPNAKEWNKRIKMYLGPIIEAFGFNRIIFASSSPSSAKHDSVPANWYELAREAVAELGIDQEGVDAIFGGNAKAVYGSA
ncbi:hypothetical protein FRB91_004236 [Serendipita sp. 411]|nr:hypothetical protein FRB91_004236 [Serendipita sp. 411]